MTTCGPDSAGRYMLLKARNTSVARSARPIAEHQRRVAGAAARSLTDQRLLHRRSQPRPRCAETGTEAERRYLAGIGSRGAQIEFRRMLASCQKQQRLLARDSASHYHGLVQRQPPDSPHNRSTHADERLMQALRVCSSTSTANLQK